MKQNRTSIGLFIFPNYDIQLKITTIIISENNINYHFVLMYFFKYYKLSIRYTYFTPHVE